MAKTPFSCLARLRRDRSGSFFDADYADERRIVADKRLTAVTGHAYLRQSAVHLRNLRSGCWTDRHHDACLPQERPLHTHSLEGINNKIDVRKTA